MRFFFVRTIAITVMYLIAESNLVVRSQDVPGGSGGSGDSGPIAESSGRTACIGVGAAIEFRSGKSPGYMLGYQSIGLWPRKLAYLFVVTHRYSDDQDCTFPDAVYAFADHAYIRQAVNLTTGSLAIDYEISADCQQQKVAAETLRVNGRVMDLTAGRVFVVDLTKRPLVAKQIACPLISQDLFGFYVLSDAAKSIWASLNPQISAGTIQSREVRLLEQSTSRNVYSSNSSILRRRSRLCCEACTP